MESFIHSSNTNCSLRRGPLLDPEHSQGATQSLYPHGFASYRGISSPPLSMVSLSAISVTCSPKILNGNFQKETIHKFKIVCHPEQCDRISPSYSIPPEARIILLSSTSRPYRFPTHRSLSSSLSYQIDCHGFSALVFK